MALINLKTNLKSLRYGSDRPGNGSSGQPYIQTDINRPGDNLIGHLDDGLIRGGALGAAKASLIDTLRISKFLTDFPKGPLFIAKQVGLQMSNPQLGYKTNLTIDKPIEKGQGLFKNIGNFVSNTANKIENAVGPTRLYNLGINTLAQVPVTAFGQHIQRHGFLPIKDNDKTYFKIAIHNNNEANNRLVQLKSILGTTNDIKNSYIGGPGSIYGLGNTIIRRRGDFIDINRDITENEWATTGSFDASKTYLSQIKVRQVKYLGVSNQTTSSLSKFPTESLDITKPEENRDLHDVSFSENDGKYHLNSNSKPIINPLNYNYLGTGSNAISNYNENLKDEGIINASLNNNAVEKNNQVLKTYSNLYNQIQTQIKKTKRVNTYVVGNNNLISSSTLSSRIKTIIPFSIDSRVGISGAHKSDEINLTPLFDSEIIGSFEDKVSIGGKIKNIQDLVKFRIQAINTDGPEQRTTWMIFRAFLTDFSDNVTADWSDIKYVGRGEKFFIYNGFTRTMNIGFKVAALSREEMEPMYQKLNYLMSNLMPDYKNNFMRGPLVRMTVGNYIDGQPGILTSLSYKISNDTPWEISINNDGSNNKELNLPHIIEVTLAFTPIGSQTRDKNLIPEKASTTSHIAQNWNAPTDGEYIYSDINKVIKDTKNKVKDKK